jgi:L-ascorbate metabolism protein UlaG (beta-lactamase superfamily)
MKVFDKGFTLTWLGHSAFHLVSPRGKHVLIDPWLEGNPMAPVGDSPITHVDVILLTHAHSDHAGDALRLAKRFGCNIVAIHEAALWFEKRGVANCVGMNKGGTAQLHGLRFTMTNASHSSSFDGSEGREYGGDPAGFVVTLENAVTVYFAGDTGPMMDMQIIGDLYRPDVSVLPIGDLYTMGPREAAYAARLLRSPYVVPSHYGTFPALTGTPETLRAELAKMGVQTQVIAPKPGESVR